MTIDLQGLVRPGHTALVTSECQTGLIGQGSMLPELAAAAQGTVLPNGARLVRAARAAGVPVIHCLALRRADDLGSNRNARLFGAMRKSPILLAPGSDAAQVVPELGVEDADLVLTRLHGLSPMSGTDLDPILRNLGLTTIVGVGVSINVAMTNLVMDAVNAGYQFVLPRDAVAGVPRSYADAIIDHTLALLATVTTAAEICEAWASDSSSAGDGRPR